MITFDTLNVAMPRFDLRKVSGWVEVVAASYGRTAGNLNYLFCNDDYILEANRQFLGHDYFTDIITFDYSRLHRIEGDMLISLDTVRSNALAVGETFERELMRVVIHGVLHLCGINDKGPGERALMEAAEEKALALLKTLNP